MKEKILSLKGADMDIDLIHNSDLDWKQDKCPWNELEGTDKHKCAVKNTSICKYFRGIKKPDTVLCGFSGKDFG
ncbi:MAG: hypothetical protein KKF46_05795 [Nanoarchaeota archaeon]|nr:hypothetical protein [Nanoarchaeota archaeon]MBU1321845.1 hypothetical protein [Nanoarchaeota archaeon]MBU1597190.1 hypothetical protein [Nanoarchaeota archaeon]MBU2441889.1 hypothetical protein [Nanoarchaeota archaeon]